MPAWIHERAKHLLAQNPSMKKETAFALATQQSHATGKTPKGYGTAAGKREAKQKFDKPKKEYVKTPNPGGLETPKLSDEPKTEWTGKHLEKKAVLDLVTVAAMRDELELRKLAVRSPYMLDKLHVEPKVRPLSAFAPKEEYRVKKAFAVSQYSGELGGGPIVYPSYIPPFKNPPVKTAGPPSESEEKAKTSAMRDELCKLNNVQSPVAQLTKTLKVGAPRASAPPGPSIQQIAKPVGFGRPIAGSTKVGV